MNIFWRILRWHYAGSVTSSGASPRMIIKKQFEGIAILLIIIGFIFSAIFFLSFYGDIRYDDKYDKVEAKIVHIGAPYDELYANQVFISYTYGGEEYAMMRISEYSSSARVGDSMDIYIDDKKPDKPILKPDVTLDLIMSIMGVSLIAAGIVFAVCAGRDIKKRLVDKGRGEKIRASVTYCGDSRKKVDFRKTYLVKASWEDADGVAHEFISDSLFVDPSRFVKVGDKIDVYIDPKNYKKYYVCAEELEKEYEKKAVYKGKMI